MTEVATSAGGEVPVYLWQTLLFLKHHPDVEGPDDVARGMDLSYTEAVARIEELLRLGLILRTE